MAKASPKAAAVPRDRTISVKLSAAEFQLIDHAASKTHRRGTNVWIRDRLVEAARQVIGEPLAGAILEGKATLALMQASLEESRATTPQAKASPDRTPPEKTPTEPRPARGRRQAGMK
jgi:hypothetical protein